MEIIVGKTAGFCDGVNNAVTKAKEELEKNGKVYCLGELVHNATVMDKLEKKGLEVVENLENLKNCKLIIRAHGVPKKIYEQAKKQNIDLIDLTCKRVLAIHELATKLINDNYYIFYISEHGHPETIGTQGFLNKNSITINCENEIEDAIKEFEKANIKKLAIISQTTFSMEKFSNLTRQIKQKLNSDIELSINRTICNATKIRQTQTEEISKKVDLMIIIGGKNSSNTLKLYDISCKNCKEAIHIQTKEDIKINLKKYNKIGVMAGASTPKEMIDDIILYIKTNN